MIHVKTNIKVTSRNLNFVEDPECDLKFLFDALECVSIIVINKVKLLKLLIKEFQRGRAIPGNLTLNFSGYWSGYWLPIAKK